MQPEITSGINIAFSNGDEVGAEAVRIAVSYSRDVSVDIAIVKHRDDA